MEVITLLLGILTVTTFCRYLIVISAPLPVPAACRRLHANVRRPIGPIDADLPSLPHLAGDSRILEPSPAHPPRH